MARGSISHERSHGEGDHPIPFRTRQLSPSSPKVLRFRPREDRALRSWGMLSPFLGRRRRRRLFLLWGHFRLPEGRLLSEAALLRLGAGRGAPGVALPRTALPGRARPGAGFLAPGTKGRPSMRGRGRRRPRAARLDVAAPRASGRRFSDRAGPLHATRVALMRFASRLFDGSAWFVLPSAACWAVGPSVAPFVRAASRQIEAQKLFQKS